MSLLAFGEALIDFLSEGGEPERFTKFPGGAPANVAVAFAKLGGSSQFCGMLGQDMFGDFLLRSLTEQGVGIEYCKQTTSAKTGLAFVSLDEKGERSFSFYRPPAADLMFEPQDFCTIAFEQARIFHVCSNSLTELEIFNTTLSGLKSAKAHQCIRSFDVNLRLNLWQQPALADARIWQCIAACDLLKVSQEELDFLLVNQNLNQKEFITKCLSLGVSLIVVSNGDLPVTYYSQMVRGQAEIPKIDVVDTTAAGDAFVGALLYQLDLVLERHGSLAPLMSDADALLTVMNFATSCGAIACTKKGAFPSLPSIDDYHSASHQKV